MPEDRFLTFRISNWGVADMEVSLFESAEEFSKLVGFLNKEPLDAISVSTYDYSQNAFGTGKRMAQIAR